MSTTSTRNIPQWPLTPIRFLPSILTLFLFLALGCAPEPQAARQAQREAPAVEAVEARSGSLPLSERLSGVVKARNQVAIHPEIEAPIVAVMVENGQAVRRGDPLVRLDDTRLAEQLRQSEAAVRLAEASAAAARARVAELEAQVVRNRALAAEELISELELETQEARLAAAAAHAEEALARVEEARANAEERRSETTKTLVRAPVDGRVGRRNAEVGMLADPNTLLFVIGDLDRLIVEVPLGERLLAKIGEGEPVSVTAEALAEPLRAEISRISPFLEAGSFSTLGEIDVANPNGRLRPGMFVTVDVLYGESASATLVPASALWEDPRSGQQGVFVLDLPSGGTPPAPEAISERPYGLRWRTVEVLAEGDGSLGIGGVDRGEWVITVGQQFLGSGEEVVARVRQASWERVLDLQDLQQEDLLNRFLDKQQRLARLHGAEPASNEEFLGSGSNAVADASSIAAEPSAVEPAAAETGREPSVPLTATEPTDAARGR